MEDVGDSSGESLHENGCKLAELFLKGKYIPVESQGIFSYAKIASYNLGTAYSNLAEDNLSS